MPLDDLKNGGVVNDDIALDTIDIQNPSNRVESQKLGLPYDQRDMTRMGKKQEMRPARQRQAANITGSRNLPHHSTKSFSRSLLVSLTLIMKFHGRGSEPHRHRQSGCVEQLDDAWADGTDLVISDRRGVHLRQTAAQGTVPGVEVQPGEVWVRGECDCALLAFARVRYDVLPYRAASGARQPNYSGDWCTICVSHSKKIYQEGTMFAIYTTSQWRLPRFQTYPIPHSTTLPAQCAVATRR
ncbi:hypothetical protein M8818_001776 [Zalaria obscura]|uniref:Uncharacterized protein n=1 Tax=Zalaria obscura TaxID=2024903 RepID=A0ACC3SKF2_9PEZI